VTEYVGATGHPGCREAVLAVWDDLVNHKMYLHGATGTVSTGNEGYSSKPDSIPPADCYGESCSVFGNFQWAHNLFRLTGDAAYIDVAERMLYNAFYASLALSDSRGVFVKHYRASAAEIPFARGVKITQRGNFPWDGEITLEVEPTDPTKIALRLRVPAWAKAYMVSVNGRPEYGLLGRGWLTIQRTWRSGDRVELELAMQIERVTMPARFTEYKDLAALQRGPIVYCLKEQDMPSEMRNSFGAYLPADFKFTAEHRPELLTKGLSNAGTAVY